MLATPQRGVFCPARFGDETTKPGEVESRAQDCSAREGQGWDWYPGGSLGKVTWNQEISPPHPLPSAFRERVWAEGRR